MPWSYSYGNSSLLSLRKLRLSLIREGGLLCLSVETKPSVTLSSPHDDDGWPVTCGWMSHSNMFCVCVCVN